MGTGGRANLRANYAIARGRERSKRIEAAENIRKRMGIESRERTFLDEDLSDHSRGSVPCDSI